MHKIHLLEGHQSEYSILEKAQKSGYPRDVVMLSIGLAISLALFSQPQNSAVNNIQSLWLSEPKNTFEWTEEKALDWVTFSQMVDIQSSPIGELYGITDYSVGPNNYRLAYKFNLENGKWTSFDKDFQVKDIKFDIFGNYYLLDTKGRLYAKNSKTQIITNNIKDFEVSSKGLIYAISSVALESNDQTKLNTWIRGSSDKGNKEYSYQYILYSPKRYSKLVVKDETPIYVDENSTIIGYGNQCIKDITVGIDGSLWALSCKQNSEKTDFQLIKWEPVRGKWYEVTNSFGVKIAAYNEISISIVDSFGRIKYSTDKNRYENVRFSEDGQRPGLFADSLILNSTNIGYVQGLIKESHYVSKICYRAAAVDGFNAEKFHEGCDYQGPTLTILKSQRGRVAGAYTSASFTSQGQSSWDDKAFIFSPDLQVVLQIKQFSEAHKNDWYAGPSFGESKDLYASLDKSYYSQSDAGNSYQLPPGLTYGSSEAQAYLFGERFFELEEIEVYSLI
ncbi:UNKNOWN [Stylonychia lemnae]|uniref:TLDc domain-containing protein n=1 Tax=Stylonychia lemnae TaxID=5949 RepID=A0A078AUA0_STYLE|nr:UNKNOWN [Stylonychia lemnae]|eukprot:CDW84413.1 UNKNOWN [Stylonychia lemnae]